MASSKKNSLPEQILALGQSVALTAQVLIKERERTNSIAKATWETMSRREKPVFVKSLRYDGYTQKEIGEIVGLSQASICQYEKKYDMAHGKD